MDGRTGLFPSNYAKGISIDGDQVVVLYEFFAGSDHDIRHMAKGEHITVLEKPATGWWLGRIGSGETGLFPSNYVKAVENAPPPPPLRPMPKAPVSPVSAPLGNPAKMPIIDSLDSFDKLIENGFVVEQDKEAPNGTIMTGNGELKHGQVLMSVYMYILHFSYIYCNLSLSVRIQGG